MQLTNKQIEAIFKMEEFAGVSSHRESFENKEDFQAYWDLLDKKCRKKKNFFKAVKDGKVSLDEIRKKREKNITEYYRDPAHLFAYAEKYYQKYLPSSCKLKKQLETKCDDVAIATKVFEEILPRLNDAKIAISLANKEARKGKGAFEVRSALSKKLFPKNIIEQALKIFVKENQIEVDDSALAAQVKKMRAKGKSTREILQKYKNSIYTKEQVQKVVEQASEDKPEDEILKNEIDKLIRKKVETKKIIQRLLGKGFLYQEIKKYL